ncbi:MAG: long-chain-fatty-acid--CoA ligase [bacterium]
MLTKTMSDYYDYMCLHYGHKTALVFADRRYTFCDLRENGLRLANSLLDAGFRKGDHIAILMPNCPEVMFLDFACTKIGISATPLATYLQVPDLLYILNDTGAQTIFYHQLFQDLVTRLRQEVPRIRRLVCSSDDPALVPAEALHLQRLMAEGAARPVASAIGPEDLCVIIYSGGTTGKPKGIVHNHRTWAATIVITSMEMGTQRNDVFLAATPLTHGARVYIIPVLLAGGSVVIHQGFNATKFLETVQKEKVTSTFVVPTMIHALMSHPDLKKYDTSTLRNVIYGAAPISPERLKQAVATFGPVFTQSYGQTEVPVAISILSREDHVLDGSPLDEARFASCGRPSLLMDVKLVDDFGREVPVGEPGEIVVRSPNTMLGYWNQPGITAETIRDGYLHTGDIARRDEYGYLYMVDRKKDMIVSGGFNVYPKEIEDLLYGHPAVAAAAVIGVPDAKWGEAVKAVVVLKPGQSASEEDLIRFCKENKGSMMAPKSVDFLESIPATPLGKPDKKKLRQKYWVGQERQIA